MKKSLILLCVVFFLFILTSCEETTEITNAPGSKPADHGPIPCFYQIIAGQNINVGYVEVINFEDHSVPGEDWEEGLLRFRIDIQGTDWHVVETHLHVCFSYDEIPKNKKGIPVPGQFEYSNESEYFSSVGDQYITYNIPYMEIPMTLEDEIPLVFAFHMTLEKTNSNGQVIQEETGWSGDVTGPSPRWWFYGNYTTQPWCR